MTLSELIEALENPTVPLRDVDIAIFKYLKPEYAGYVEGRGGLVHRCDGEDQAAKLIEEGFDRPGIAKKQDTCAHGKFGWEDCESCAAAAIRALIPEREG